MAKMPCHRTLGLLTTIGPVAAFVRRLAHVRYGTFSFRFSATVVGVGVLDIGGQTGAQCIV